MPGQKPTLNHKSHGLSLAGLVLCLGCTVGPDYQAPQIEVPNAWHTAVAEDLNQDDSALHSWWSTLNDPLLNDLLERSSRENLDLELAFHRIREAQALRGVAGGERFPDLDGTGFARRSRTSEGTSSIVPPPQSRTDNFFGLGLNAAWELDLFGRITRSIESSDARLSATIENYRDTLVVLFAEVALNYVELRSLQARLSYARVNVTNQEESLEIARARFETGLSPELDLRQAQLNLATTRSTIPQLETLETMSIHRICVLLGAFPRDLADRLSPPAPIPIPDGVLAVGIPADILRRRPDIRAAERNLAAQTARIGVATADLYPRFSLAGSFGLESIADLIDWKNRSYGIGLDFLWNLFDGGRVRNRVLAEEARTQQALAIYEQTLLRSLEDVENSLVAYNKEKERRQELENVVVAAEKTVELVRVLYRSGVTDFQNVLDSERTLTSSQDSLADSEGQVVKNLINLYRAVGGGWNPQSSPVLSGRQGPGGEPRF